MGKKKRAKNKEVRNKKEVAQAAPNGKVPLKKSISLRTLVLAILIFAVTFLVYANTLKSAFIWDDEYLILHNSQVKSTSHIPNVFKTYVGYGSENKNNFYRPIQELSNMMDYHLWEGKPGGFHLTNVLLHSSVAALVFFFLLYATKDFIASAVAAFFYGIHPVHTEAVAYIAGRADPLYSVFLLLTLIFYAKFIERVDAGKPGMAWYGLSIGFYAASLLSKELAIMLPVLMILYLFCFVRGKAKPETYKRTALTWIPFAGLAGVYVFLRTTVLDFSALAPPSIFERIPIGYRLLTFARSILVYFRLLIAPYDLHMERIIPVSRTLLGVQEITALIIVGSLIYLIFRVYNRNRAVSFGLAWFFITLIPLSNIIPINSFLAEHWIYMASVGIFLVFGKGISFCWGYTSKKYRYAGLIITALLAIIAAGYGTTTVFRNKDWANEITFFKSTLEYHPKNTRLHLNLGNTYMEKGEVDKAIAQYETCISINPKYAVAYGNLGGAYLRKGEPRQAAGYLKQAIALKYDYPIAHYNLGIIEFNRKQYDRAIVEFDITTSQLPQMYQAWNMKGRTYLQTGRKAEAAISFERSLAIMPGQPGIRKILQKIRQKP